MNEDEPRTLFVFRTTAKRNPPMLLKRPMLLSNRNATLEEFEDLRARLAQVHSWLVGIHQRFMQLADLNEAERHNAELYLQAINNQQLICLNFIAFAIANRPSHRQTWEVSNHENATRNRTEPIQQNRPEETRCRSSNSITRLTISKRISIAKQRTRIFRSP